MGKSKSAGDMLGEWGKKKSCETFALSERSLSDATERSRQPPMARQPLSVIGIDDNPKAVEHLAAFMTRAVADEGVAGGATGEEIRYHMAVYFQASGYGPVLNLKSVGLRTASAECPFEFLEV